MNSGLKGCNMDNNTAFVAKLGNIKPIEGADKIVVAQVILNDVPITQVIVGVDTKENTPVVYFDSNLCIDEKVITAIDKLSPDYENKDFKSLDNYLAKGNRVRVVKLRGVISNGLAVEVEKFYQFFKTEADAVSTLVHGYSFTELNKMEVCKKWYPHVNRTNISNKEKKVNKKKISRIIPELFHFHIDTQQLLRNLHCIKPEQVISISRKIHGTSAICANVPVHKKLNVKEKIAKFFGVPVIETEYDYLYASRTVVKNDATHDGFYGVDLWSKVGKENFLGKLNKGETVYYEIVGYVEGDKMIQKGYDYGCTPGTYKIAVYRITYTNEEGKVFEYSWQAVKERCIEMNVPMVQEYYFGKAKDLYSDLTVNENWAVEFAERLKKSYLEKKVEDNLGKKVPDEGIVLRIEAKDITVFKLKSEAFFLHESTAKEDESNVDIEDEEASIVQE